MSQTHEQSSTLQQHKSCVFVLSKALTNLTQTNTEHLMEYRAFVNAFAQFS